jgi:PPOX class F420-dependent enzyme/OxyR family protein
MSAFTPAELAFLDSQRVGRIATVGRTEELHVVPVRFRYNPARDTIDVTGRFLGRSKKYRDVQVDSRVAFVADGVSDSGQVCGVEVRGSAEVMKIGGDEITPGADPEFIRITPTRIVSWGIDSEPHHPRSRRVSVPTFVRAETAAAHRSSTTPADLYQMIIGGRVAQAVYVAAKLRIADALADGPKTAAELANVSDTHAPSLYRLLRALASLGVFAEEVVGVSQTPASRSRTPDGSFRLTPLADLLRSDMAGSLRAAALHFGDPFWWRTMGELLYSVQTGKTAPQHLYGVDEWRYLAQHPETAAVFNDSMTANTRRQIPAILAAYDFSEIGTLVDVAGGHGALLSAILGDYSAMRGILFDLPPVVAGAGPLLQAGGVAERCEIVGGNMFETIPGGGDAYLLKLILHDWDDERASQILENVRRAMGEAARLLLVENVIEPGNEPQPAKLLDLVMLVNFGGRERTTVEWEDLLAKAGFRLARIVPTRANVSIIEASPF